MGNMILAFGRSQTIDAYHRTMDSEVKEQAIKKQVESLMNNCSIGSRYYYYASSYLTVTRLCQF